MQRDQLLTLVQLYKALGGGWEMAGNSQEARPPVFRPAKTAVKKRLMGN
ncbi:MAG: hypothetical protein ACOZF2_00645 [Thermodesulfobacteriota bacterium]